MEINEAMDIVDNPDNPLFKLFWYGDTVTYAAVVTAIKKKEIVMAKPKYRALKRFFDGQLIREPGEVFDFELPGRPSPKVMEPVNEEARDQNMMVERAMEKPK